MLLILLQAYGIQLKKRSRPRKMIIPTIRSIQELIALNDSRLRQFRGVGFPAYKIKGKKNGSQSTRRKKAIKAIREDARRAA